MKVLRNTRLWTTALITLMFGILTGCTSFKRHDPSPVGTFYPDHPIQSVYFTKDNFFHSENKISFSHPVKIKAVGIMTWNSLTGQKSEVAILESPQLDHLPEDYWIKTEGNYYANIDWLQANGRIAYSGSKSSGEYFLEGIARLLTSPIVIILVLIVIVISIVIRSNTNKSISHKKSYSGYSSDSYSSDSYSSSSVSYDTNDNSEDSYAGDSDRENDEGKISLSGSAGNDTKVDVNFSIRIVGDDGDPVSGVKVTVSENVLLGHASESEYTDRDGWVSFGWNTIMENFYDVSVYVEGTKVGRYTFRDGDSTSFVYPT